MNRLAAAAIIAYIERADDWRGRFRALEIDVFEPSGAQRGKLPKAFPRAALVVATPERMERAPC